RLHRARGVEADHPLTHAPNPARGGLTPPARRVENHSETAATGERTMPSILVICPDRQRLAFLQQVVRQFNPRDSGKVVGAASVGAAQRRTPGLVNAVLLSLVGGGQPTRELPELQRSFPATPVLVELDCDDPEQAFAVLRLGAYSVVVSK